MTFKIELSENAISNQSNDWNSQNMAITHLKNIPTKRKRILTRFTYVYVRKNILLYKTIITDNIDNITAKKKKKFTSKLSKQTEFTRKALNMILTAICRVLGLFFKEGVNEMNRKWLVLNGPVA